MLKSKQKLSLKTSTLTPDDLLSTAMGALIEPLFDPHELVVITDFPPSQAALAVTCLNKEQELVAMRFEIYSESLELANGYQELACAQELSKRFTILNQLRLSQNKTPYPLDESLLEAMTSYFPSCCGVACGFDRLLMIETKSSQISLIQSLPSV